MKRTIEMIGDITNMYSTGFNKMASDPNFSVNELEAIALGYAKLLEEGGALVTELKTIITGGNGLSLSDKERMDVIDQIYTKMVDYRNLTQYYTNKISPSPLSAASKKVIWRGCGRSMANRQTDTGKP